MKCGKELREGAAFCDHCGAKATKKTLKLSPLSFVLGILLAVCLAAVFLLTGVMRFGSGGGSVDAQVTNTEGTSYAWSGDALDAAVESGELVMADTIEELAEKIGVNTANLARTLAAWNEDTAAGNPDPFGRVDGLSPIEAPFYAYRNTPFNLGALGGLKITRKCEVVKADGTVIPGLYAAGLTAGGWVGPYYPGSGTAIMGTCYFGRTAGEAAATAE